MAGAFIELFDFASCLHYLERERTGNWLTNFEVFFCAGRGRAKCFTSNEVRGTFSKNFWCKVS